MSKNKPTPAPRPYSPQELIDIRVRMDRAYIGTKLLLAASAVMALVLFATEGAQVGTLMQPVLLFSGLLIALAAGGTFYLGRSSNMTLMPAGLSATNLNWLRIARERVPTVEQFMADVEAQNRSLLACEYAALSDFYSVEVCRVLLSNEARIKDTLVASGA